MMDILYIIIGAIILNYSWKFVKKEWNLASTRRHVRKWRVGDILEVNNSAVELFHLAAEQHPYNYPWVTLIKWCEYEVIIKTAEEEVWYVEIGKVKNVALKQRQSVERMNKFIPKDQLEQSDLLLKQATSPPLPPVELKTELKDGIYYINDIPLKDLVKEELEGVLEEVLGLEDYDLAAKIRDELKKFNE